MTMTTLSAREERGVAIAKSAKIARRGECYLVPSQSGNRKYSVFPKREKPFCSCRDHEATGADCKHSYAVRYFLQAEQHADGSVTVTETMTVTERQTYQQDRPAYDAAQPREKPHVLQLARE